jgi:toxin ParE1/3/4
VAAEVVLSREARDDLFAIHLWVAEEAGAATAEDYDARIRRACLSLAEFPRRGTPRPELGAGVRSIPFERQATIAYRVAGGAVEILSIAHRGRDLGTPLT